MGAVGEGELNPLSVGAKGNLEPVVGAVGYKKSKPLVIHAKKNLESAVGVIGHEESNPLIVVYEANPKPAIGAIGHEKSKSLTVVYQENIKPAVGAIGQEESKHLAFAAERNHQPLVGAIGNLKEGPIKFLGTHVHPPPFAVHSQDPLACTWNTDCGDDEVCLREKCVKGCVLASGVCVGHAVCRTRNHVPSCQCLNMSTAITRRSGGRNRYDCMPMAMMEPVARNRVEGRNLFRRPRPITVQRGWLHPQERLVVQGPQVSTFSRPQTSFIRQESPFSRPLSTFSSEVSRDPCSPTPCGPYTRCQTSHRTGNAQCRCIDDYVPDGNTINGCKVQCEIEDDCPDDYRCQRNKCARVCSRGACGTNANCDARRHRAVCTCPQNYRGNADTQCIRIQQEARVAPPAPPHDPCSPSPCGHNADCRTRGDRAVCTCPLGYEGDPLTDCRKGECIESNDCPGHLVCQRLRCIDPCDGDTCGQGAECATRNHQPICSCPRGYVGDPFVNCRRFDPQELCHPTPCGHSTNCKVRNDRAVCSCIDNYIGNPLTGCKPECVSDGECPHNMACRNNICVNPCRDACGEGAYCDVRNSRAVCSCPEYYQGSPQSRCYAECTAHDDCPSYQACYQLQCVNPCDGACGTGADCKVEEHKPICSCPRGYTGHPFESCRPFTKEDLCNPNPCGIGSDCTPGFDSSGNDRPVCTCPRGFIGNPLFECTRGECETNEQCSNHQGCFQYTCQNSCFFDGESVCGENADCNVKNHQPVCSCPRGYSGDPRHECRIGRGHFDRHAIGRSRK